MTDWIQSFLAAHYVGIIVSFVAYLFFQALVGGMPPLPESSGYWQRWAYGFLHALALNWRFGLKLLKIPVPDDPVIATAAIRESGTVDVSIKQRDESVKP